MLSAVKTKIWLMKSRIFLISLEMEEDPFMSLTNSVAVLKLKRKSFKLLWKRQKVHWKQKKIRFFEPSWNLAKLDKKLIAKLLRKKSSKIPAKIMPGLWTPCKQVLDLSNAQKLKLLESRRSLRVRSMS